MTRHALYYIHIPAGTVWIRRQPGDPDRVQLMFNDDAVGSYHSPAAAADDAGGGHSGCAAIDKSAAIPSDLADWDHGGG